MADLEQVVGLLTEIRDLLSDGTTPPPPSDPPRTRVDGD